MPDSQSERSQSFGEDPVAYDRNRPGYPEALVDDLVRASSIRGSCDVVDVGCGTGIAARLFVARGCNVVGVEADERMAAVARSHGLTVEIARFEEWHAGARTFDLLTSAQAWHWIDPEAGPRQAAGVLRSGGVFAAFWNNTVLAPEVMRAIEPVYTRLAPHLLADSVALGTATPDRDNDVAGLVATAAFTNIERRNYSTTRAYTVDGWLDELVTHSGHRVLPARTRDQLVAELGSALHPLRAGFASQVNTSLLWARRV